jgi:hypothetical protein
MSSTITVTDQRKMGHRLVPSAPAMARIAPSGEKATAKTTRVGASLPP